VNQDRDNGVIAAVHMTLKAETPNKYRYTPSSPEQMPATGDLYVWKGCFRGAPPPKNLLMSIRSA
jgi:hypothetical protein